METGNLAPELLPLTCKLIPFSLSGLTLTHLPKARVRRDQELSLLKLLQDKAWLEVEERKAMVFKTGTRG